MNKMCANPKKWFLNDDGSTNTDFIRQNERLESLGSKHCPISSAVILEKFRDKANSLGIELYDETAALLRPYVDKNNGGIMGGNRFMYIANVRDNSHPDYALSVGFRNFGDKTLSFSGMCGTSIFVCENGVCTSICKPSKFRHTFGNVNTDGFIDMKVDAIFGRFMADRDEIHGQIETMRSVPLTNEIVGAFLKKANGEWVKKNDEWKFVKNPLLGSANLLRIMEDLENPERNDRNDNSCFRLMNSCSHITSHVIKNPNQSAMASRFCNNLIMSLIKSDFRPLGDDVDGEDVIDVESEVVAA